MYNAIFLYFGFCAMWLHFYKYPLMGKYMNQLEELNDWRMVLKWVQINKTWSRWKMFALILFLVIYHFRISFYQIYMAKRYFWRVKLFRITRILQAGERSLQSEIEVGAKLCRKVDVEEPWFKEKIRCPSHLSSQNAAICSGLSGRKTQVSSLVWGKSCPTTGLHKPTLVAIFCLNFYCVEMCFELQ